MKILRLTVLLAASLSFFQIKAQAVLIDRVEATVNNSIILLSDVINFREQVALVAQLDPLFSNHSIAAKGARASDHDIVEFLIDEHLISQAFPVDDDQVEQEINSIQSNNNIDKKALISALESQGFLYQDYFERIRRSLAKRNLIDRDIRTRVYISDDDIKNYFYNRYASRKGSNLSYHIKMITIDPSNYRSESAARTTANDALQKIKAGESFEDVAKRYSEDSLSSSGGDLGVLSEEEMSPLVKKVVKQLKVGEISPIVGSLTSGFFILKLEDIKSGQEDRLNELKEQIRSHLTTREYQNQINLWLDRSRQESFIHLVGDTSSLTN